MKRTAWILLTATVWAGAFPLPLLAQSSTEYTSIPPKTLLDNPQRYWAKGIVFRDALASYPTGRQINLKNQVYPEIRTKVLGSCYVHPDIVEGVRAIPLEREYLFFGTVVQIRQRFYVIVNKIEAAFSLESVSAEFRRAMAASDRRGLSDGMQPMADMVTDLQAAFVAYIEQNDLDPAALFDPSTDHYTYALNAVRNAVGNQEQNLKMPLREVVTQFLFALMAENLASTRRPPTLDEDVDEDVEETQREEASTDEDEPSAEVSPPPRRSRWKFWRRAPRAETPVETDEEP